MRSIMNVKTNQKGFTLIELVVVIVILGILAVTAVPKFIDLTGDARKGVMIGVQGNIESAVSIAHSKAILAGQTAADGEITIDSLVYAMVNGYPAAVDDASADGTTSQAYGVTKLIDVDSVITVTSGDPATFQHSGAPTPGTCQITYTKADSSSARPVIAFNDAGC